MNAHSTIQQISCHAIISATAHLFDVKPGEIVGKSRVRPLVWYRMAAMAVAYRLTGKSRSQVGAAFGGRDPTTVIHAIQVAESIPDVATMSAKIEAQVMATNGEGVDWVRAVPFTSRRAPQFHSARRSSGRLAKA